MHGVKFGQGIDWLNPYPQLSQQWCSWARNVSVYVCTDKICIGGPYRCESTVPFFVMPERYELLGLDARHTSPAWDT